MAFNSTSGDSLLRKDDALNVLVEDDSVLGKLLTKSAVTNYDRTTDSLEALREAVDAGGGGGSGELQSSRDFWSGVTPTITITATGSTIAVTPTIVIPSSDAGLPSAATLTAVHLLAKWRQIENTANAINAIDATTMAIQIDDAGDTGFLTAFTFADNVYSVGKKLTQAGDMFESITDISARVDAADTYDIQFINAEVDSNNLVLRDFQWGLRIWWQ